MGGLETTWRVLATTKNETATDVLLAVLDDPREEYVVSALRALLMRRDARGLTEIVRRWDRFSTTWKEVVREQSGRLTGALRDALVQDEPSLFANACAAAVWLGEFDLIPVLVNVAEAPMSPRAQQAATTLLRLAELLQEQLTSTRERARRSDPLVVRTRVVAALEKSLLRWPHHQRHEILEAFLLLCPRDNATLKHILNHPHDPAYLRVLELLGHSGQTGIVRLLLSYLDDRQAPTAALQTLARRHDPEFLSGLLKKIGYEPSAAARRNLKLIQDFPWLRTHPARFDELDDAGQHAAVQMLAASAIKPNDLRMLIEYVLKKGRPAGRRAAAEALRRLQGADANRLVLDALHDSDPLIQAAALGHVRQRALPGAMTRVVELLESDHETVRAAARKCLADFTCERFLMAFDMLSPEARQSTGKLVAKVDLRAVVLLGDELGSSSRNRRIRALEATAATGLAPALEERLIAMLAEEDHYLRVKAAEALRYCDTPRVKQALRERLLDPHLSVQSAVEASLVFLSRGEETQPAPTAMNDTEVWNPAPVVSSPITQPS